MTTTTIADATGTGAIAVDSKIIIITVINVHASMKTLSTLMPSARKTAPCISGRAMEDATMRTMYVVVTGTVETAVDTLKDQISISMATARNANVSILPCLINAMENARCSHGVGMATATIITTTVAVIGMVGTAVGKKRHSYTVKTVFVRTRATMALHAVNHATKLVGRGIKRAMMKITTAVVDGMVETVVAPPKILTTFIAKCANAWTPTINRS